jgi:hypothetical protein
MRKAIVALAITLTALGALFYYVHWLQVKPPGKHTRVDVVKHNLTVWTYLPITAMYDGQAWTYPNDHIAVEVRDDADITLAGKYRMVVREGHVTVNGQEIADGDLNAFVTDDGQVERHTFIRTGWE